MTFRRSSLLIRKSLLTNALSKWLYPSLFQLSLASILFSIFLFCLSILRKPAVYITCVSFCTEIIIAYRRRAEPFHCNSENISNLRKDTKQPAIIVYFLLENVNKHGYFQILFPQLILLVPSFPRMKSGNNDFLLSFDSCFGF